MVQPEGFNDGSERVCRLKRALYGLKQAPRAWYFTLAVFLKSIGFSPCAADSSVFFNKNKDVIIAVYVDDLLLFGRDPIAISRLKISLNERFLMKDLGPVSYYLGVYIQRDRSQRTLSLSQTAYMDKVLNDFQMTDVTPVDTPMATDCKLRKAQDGYESPPEFH